MRKINKKELIRLIYYETGYSIPDVSVVIDTLARLIYEQLKLEPTRMVFGGLVFESKEIPVRNGVSNLTGEPYVSPKHMVIKANVNPYVKKRFKAETTEVAE